MPRIPRKPPINGRVVHPTVSHAKTQDDDVDDAAPTAASEDVLAAPAPVDALSELMTSLQGASSARINVYRIVKNQPPSYVFECAPESFSLDELRDKYNGGEFRLYVMKEGRLWKNTRVIVEPRQIIHNGVDPSPPTQMFDMMALIRDGFSAQTAALREIAPLRGGGSPMFSGLDLPAVITAAAAAITALRPPPAPPPPAAPDTTSQALDMFMKGMQIAMDVRDNTPSGDNSLGGMLRDALRSPVVAAAVQASMAPPPVMRPPPQQALPSPPQTTPVSHAKTDSPPTAPAAPDAAMIAHYLGFLVQKASSGADPELYAEFVLDNLNDDQLIPMIQRGAHLIDDFIAAHPAVANHRAWFESLIQSVTAAMSVDDEPSDPAAQRPMEVQHAVDATPPIIPGNSAQ